MTVKNLLRRAFEKATKTHVFRVLPHGVDVFTDINRSLPLLGVQVVFDVGANVGDSTREYLAAFPGSTVYCFEPIENTFNELTRNLMDNGRVQPFNLALAASTGSAEMFAEDVSTMSRLVATVNDRSTDGTVPIVKVSMDTIDNFCRARSIDHIGFLKIDTEGADLDVLKGAEAMLSQQKIDVVQIEAGMNQRNRRHVPFERLKELLESQGYFLFGIYEQVPEWPSKEPQLRRTNSVFISDAVVAANRAV